MLDQESRFKIKVLTQLNTLQKISKKLKYQDSISKIEQILENKS